MSYCPKCGIEVPVDTNSCDACGAILPTNSEQLDLTGQERNGLLISPSRILGMSLISSGLYLFYWFYLTWRQYRSHSGTEAYPVWHALTLLIPIYSWFRVHAHVRTINDMVSQQNIAPALSPLLAVALIVTQQALGWVSFSITYDVELTRSIFFSTIVLDLISIVLGTVFVLNIQTSLNKFWGGGYIGQFDQTGSSSENIATPRVISIHLSSGEKIIGAIGGLLWILTIRQLLIL